DRGERPCRRADVPDDPACLPFPAMSAIAGHGMRPGRMTLSAIPSRAAGKRGTSRVRAAACRRELLRRHAFTKDDAERRNSGCLAPRRLLARPRKIDLQHLEALTGRVLGRRLDLAVLINKKSAKTRERSATAMLAANLTFDRSLVADPVDLINQIPGSFVGHAERAACRGNRAAALDAFEKLDFSSLKGIHSGGAAVPIEIENRIKSITGLQLGGGWGMTETAPAGANIPSNRPDLRGSIGLPLPGILMDVVALDNPRRVLPPGEIGEIRIKGPNVTRGYWNRPEESAAAFVDGYLLTGDIGYMDAEGFFFLTDRKKDMIISGGFNVYPRMIEEAIYEHPAVEEVIVIGIPDAYRGQAAKAFIKLKAGAAPFTLDELRDFLTDKIGRHELPAAIEFRESLPKTAVGKLSKKELVAEEVARRAVAAEPAST
ncbi:MAG: AMP-binding protein, partial [Hyphomicrobium sp.]|nr:AMP-binding protein [Hyphomicrobium sp.]